MSVAATVLELFDHPSYMDTQDEWRSEQTGYMDKREDWQLQWKAWTTQ